MRWKRDIEVLVAGAGPVGLVSAIALAAKGVQVAIVDEAPDQRDRRYATLLHPRSLELLDDLGLGGAVRSAGHRVGSLACHAPDGRLLSRHAMEAQSRRWPYMLTVRHDRLVALLEEHLARRGITVSQCHRLRSFEQASNAVRVQLDRVEPHPAGYGGGRVLDAVEPLTSTVRFLVAADGVQSSARKALTSFPMVGPTIEAALFEFQPEREAPAEVRLVAGAPETSIWPLSDGKVRLLAQLDGEFERAGDGLALQVGAEVFRHLNRDLLSQLVEARAPWLGRSRRIDWGTGVRFETRVAEVFGRGRVFLLGDAAHRLPPALSWSLNLGLREGVELASLLTANLRHAAPLGAIDEFPRRWATDVRRFVGRNAAPAPGLPIEDALG